MPQVLIPGKSPEERFGTSFDKDSPGERVEVVRYLVAEVERLQGENAKLREAMERLRKTHRMYDENLAYNRPDSREDVDQLRAQLALAEEQNATQAKALALAEAVCEAHTARNYRGDILCPCPAHVAWRAGET